MDEGVGKGMAHTMMRKRRRSRKRRMRTRRKGSGPSWCPPGALFGPFWNPLGAPRGGLDRVGGLPRSPRRGQEGPERGGPRRPQEAKWLRNGMLLGPSWSPLGAFLGPRKSRSEVSRSGPSVLG
eukprot:1138016-Pyramimonas_sp.AAC.1